MPPEQRNPILHRPRPRVGIRAWAILLVLAAVVPLLIFAWLTLDWMARTHADGFTKNQADTARILANAVNDELHGWKMLLTALAQSQALQSGRLAEFYEEAKAVAAQQDGWIVLTDAAGQQVLNTLRPYGSPLPTTSAPALLHAILAEAKPVVSDLVFGKVAQRWLIAVAVPISREGRVAYMLDMSFPPDRLTQLLERQRLSTDWTAVVLDSQHQVVARRPLSQERIGKSVPPWFAAAVRASAHGIATGLSPYDVPIRAAFNRLTEAPWVVSLSIPLAAFPSPRPVYGFLALGVVLGCLAVGLALYASRQLTRPVAELAENAERLLRGAAMDYGPASGLREIEHLWEALVTAAASVQALQREEARAAMAEERARLSTESAEAMQQLNATLEQRVQARTADLQRLTGELALAEQRERQRLALMLHDGLQQLLVAAKMRATLLDKHRDPTVQAASRDLQKLLDESIAASRSLTAELSPPILESGLIPALQWLSRWMQDTHGLTVHLNTDAPVLPIANSERLLLFQVVRELLFNVKKHAQVSEASVVVSERHGAVQLVVSDAGAGFDPQTLNTSDGGFGLFSIRERLRYVGGDMAIASAPSQGSKFTLTVPLQASAPSA